MSNQDQLFNDVRHRLVTEKNITCQQISHIQDRPFSSIYELECHNDNDTLILILKVSRTHRTCKSEFEAYNILSSKNILSLKTILLSEQYNYLITVKENVCDFIDIVKSKGDMPAMFEKLGAYLKRLELATARETTFNADEYWEYVEKRLALIKCLNSKAKDLVSHKINKLLQKMENKPVTNSLVSDLSIGNIHVTSENEILLIDMGDAYYDSYYANLAGVYLGIKYSLLNKYIEKKETTLNCFNRFLLGYGCANLDRVQFVLYQIKQLLSMIIYVERINYGAKSVMKMKKMISDKVLLIKCRNHLVELLEEET